MLLMCNVKSEYKKFGCGGKVGSSPGTPGTLGSPGILRTPWYPTGPLAGRPQPTRPSGLRRIP